MPPRTCSPRLARHNRPERYPDRSRYLSPKHADRGRLSGGRERCQCLRSPKDSRFGQSRRALQRMSGYPKRDLGQRIGRWRYRCWRQSIRYQADGGEGAASRFQLPLQEQGS